MKKLLHTSQKSGFTLVELLMAVLILTIGIVGVLSFVISSSATIQLSKELTLATIHGDYILEEMHTKNTLSDITGTNWDVNSLDPELQTLSNEVITVAYADEDSDPLGIMVNVSWSNIRGNYNINFITEMTK